MTEQENILLYGSEKQFGIYQITERDPEHDYRFMGLDYVEKKGITVTRADYDPDLCRTAYGKRTRWMAFMNGSISSVRQILRVIRCRSATWWYSMMAVQSKPTMWTALDFAELPDFFKERNMDLQKETLLNEELQGIEIFDKPGLFQQWPTAG